MKILFTLFLCFMFLVVTAQWNNNPAINNLVAKTNGDDQLASAITDGAGGTILFFSRNDDDVFMQKVSATGTLPWSPGNNPTMVCQEINYQGNIVAIPDGTGGAFVAWEDYRHMDVYGEIYMQHISATGAALWEANGRRITISATVDDYFPAVCTDGAGGVIVSWIRDNDLDDIQAFAQRINSTGTTLWATNGVQVCTAPGFRGGNNIVSDGSNGCILFFLDTRNDPNGSDYAYIDSNDITNGDIYAQRISASGSRLWTNNGVAVCTATGNQESFTTGTAIPDGNGGAIFAFDDARNDVPDVDGNPTNYDLYVQKLNSNGVAQWAQNGVPLSNAGGNQYINGVSTDGSGGIAVVFVSNLNNTMYTQRISSAGNPSWAINGLAVSLPGQDSYEAKITEDGSGNFIIAYVDEQTPQLLAQKMNAGGTFLWGAGGVTITNSGNRPGYIQMVSAGSGNAILTWSHGFSFSKLDIYAAKILSNGVLDGSSAASSFVTIANGNWNSPSTWLGGIIPSSDAIVTVKHNVTVTANTTCKSLKVETVSGNVTVKAGVQLTVTN